MFCHVKIEGNYKSLNFYGDLIAGCRTDEFELTTQAYDLCGQFLRIRALKPLFIRQKSAMNCLFLK